MSKLVKELIMDEYHKMFEGIDDAVVVDIRALNANQNTEFREGLRTSGTRVTVVRNRLAGKAFKDTGLANLNTIMQGPNAVVYGEQSVVETARAIMDWTKKIKKIEVKGAVLDGDIYKGKDGVELLSKFPTRSEAQAQVVQIILSPAGNLLSAVTAPGSQITSILQTIVEKLEKGEFISKAG